MGRLTVLKQIAQDLASEFGPDCEVVIHDLKTKDPEHSIVYIVNGHVTGRSIGDGPSDAVFDVIRNRNHKGSEPSDHSGYLMKTGEYFISQYIDALAAEGEIDQSLISRNKSLIVGYYKCLFFGVIIEWLESGMDEQLAKDFRRIFRLKADTADELADILRSQL